MVDAVGKEKQANQPEALDITKGKMLRAPAKCGGSCVSHDPSPSGVNLPKFSDIKLTYS